MVVDSLRPRSGNVEGAEVLQAVALLLAAGIPRPDAASPSRCLMLAVLMAEYEDTIVAIVLPALIGALCSTCAVAQEASAWACCSWTSGVASICSSSRARWTISSRLSTCRACWRILHRCHLTRYVLHRLGAQGVLIEVCGFLLARVDGLR